MAAANQYRIFFWTAPRLRVSFAIASGVLGYLLSAPLEQEMRLLLGYDLSVAAYLGLMLARVYHADADDTRELAERKETSNVLILGLAVLFTFCSLAGAGLMLYRSQDWSAALVLMQRGLSLVAIFLSWILLHTVFAMHYARLYYEELPAPHQDRFRQGLEFPDGALPDFWDFLYYAFTISVCYQTSDVTTKSRTMRRLTLAHAMISFLNVTVILGLVIEIVSTMVSTSK
ncbi:MAG: DUF1345 domain-containing protein [Planctomycetales bacterium]